MFAGRMYVPGHFAESDPAILRDAVREIGVGHLVTMGGGGIEASFVPLLISDDAGTVSGHLARANRQWERADPSVAALVTWVGPDAYVSPSYYPSTREHGRTVPTWDFITIQVTGALVLHDDDEWKRAHVSALADAHEGALPAPWSVDDAPSEFIDAMVRAIVGIEVRVATVEGKWKLSQNRPAPDVAGVIAGLVSRGTGTAAAVAGHVRAASPWAG